jgi:choline dehydrogenase-like flavoprotein
MADDFDVVIVGSGFAGALIANELAKRGKSVAILEAGDGIPPNINDFMERFYKSSAKVPESPYTPPISDEPARGAEPRRSSDPREMRAGRPTVLMVNPDDWADSNKSYLVQEKTRDGKKLMPFSSTYDRIAGGTSHWLGTCLRFVPNDFKMKSLYGRSEASFVDWPIGYEDLVDWYGKAEAELGVSADIEDQRYLDIYFPDGYQYPMSPIPDSPTDRAVRKALKNLDAAKTEFLGMQRPPTEIPVRNVPAARNSQPYRGRRACAGNTNCIPICPIQAKYDPTITLNEALSHKHVKLMTHTVAREVILDPELRKVAEIKYTRYSPRSNATVTDTIKAKIFVIAGNAIETARLLLMSENDALPFQSKTVANSSGMVGKHLMDHPYYVAWGQLPMDGEQLWPYRGPLITSGIGDLCDGEFRGKRAAFRVDIGNEGWNFVIASVVGAADPHVTTIDFVNGIDRNRLKSKHAAAGIPGPPPTKALYGPALTGALNANISRQFRVGFLIEQTPDAGNRVTLARENPDGLGLPRPKITYDLSPYTRRGIIAAHRFKDLLFDRMHATDFTMVSDNDPSRFDEQIDGETVRLNFTGAGHIMGTYRMGTSKDNSVVDSYQRSHDHDNLYLVGSGTFPTGATANPTLTIAALALRTADRIAKRV